MNFALPLPKQHFEDTVQFECWSKRLTGIYSTITPISELLMARKATRVVSGWNTRQYVIPGARLSRFPSYLFYDSGCIYGGYATLEFVVVCFIGDQPVAIQS